MIQFRKMSYYSIVFLIYFALMNGNLLSGQLPASLRTQMTALGIQMRNGHSNSVSFDADTSGGWQDTTRINESGCIAGHISGVDFSEGGRVEITAYMVDDPGNVPWYKGYTSMDSSGTYCIEPLSPGFYYVYVWASGYAAQFYDYAEHEAEATLVEVVAHQVTDHINFDLEKRVPGAGRLSGVVLDTFGEPVDSATVYAWDPDLRYMNTGEAFTDETGAYQISGLYEGNYYVQVWADGYLREWFDNAKGYHDALRVAVSETGETEEIDFYLSPGGIITGQVTYSDGTPVVGTFVEAYTPKSDSIEYILPEDDPVSKSTITDSLGCYVLSCLPEGEYFVKAGYRFRPYYLETWYDGADSFSDATPVPVFENEITSGIDLSFPPLPDTSSISGTVTDNSGTPVSGAFVHLRYANYPERSSIGGYAETDSAGHYQIPFVQAEVYYIYCGTYWGNQLISQFYPGVENMDEAEPFAVTEGETYTGINFTLPFSKDVASISGMVQNMNGDPLSYVGIEAWNMDDQASVEDSKGFRTRTITDTSGHYQLEELPAGTYQLYASYFDWVSGAKDDIWYQDSKTQANATPVTLVKNERKTGVDFQLDPKSIYGTVSGRVLSDGNGEPLENAVVELQIASYKSRSEYYWIYQNNDNAVTDASGYFQIDHILEGDYKIVAYTNGGYTWYPNAVVSDLAETIHVVSAQDVSVNIAVPLCHNGEGTIKGTVRMGLDYWLEDVMDTLVYERYRDSDRMPIAHAVVVAKPAISILSWPESEWFYCGVTDEQGEYAVSGLPDGEYLVSAFSGNYLYQYYDQQYVASDANLVTIENGQIVESIDFYLLPSLLCVDNGDGETRNAGEIAGIVCDGEGNSLSRAIVYLYLENQPVGYVLTDSDGNFCFSNLTDGTYTLQASKSGDGSAYLGGSADISNADVINLSGNRESVQLELAQTSAVTPDVRLPEKLALLGNYPNPFNPETEIRYALPKEQQVRLTVYNSLGQVVQILADQKMQAGYYRTRWNGLDQTGRAVGSGIYFYQLETADRALTGKMVLIR